MKRGNRRRHDLRGFGQKKLRKYVLNAKSGALGFYNYNYDGFLYTSFRWAILSTNMVTSLLLTMYTIL